MSILDHLYLKYITILKPQTIFRLVLRLTELLIVEADFHYLGRSVFDLTIENLRTISLTYAHSRVTISLDSKCAIYRSRWLNIDLKETLLKKGHLDNKLNRGFYGVARHTQLFRLF